MVAAMCGSDEGCERVMAHSVDLPPAPPWHPLARPILFKFSLFFRTAPVQQAAGCKLNHVMLNRAINSFAWARRPSCLEGSRFMRNANFCRVCWLAALLDLIQVRARGSEGA